MFASLVACDIIAVLLCGALNRAEQKWPSFTKISRGENELKGQKRWKTSQVANESKHGSQKVSRLKAKREKRKPGSRSHL